MVLTRFDLVEIAAIATLWVFAWWSPIRVPACSTVLALVVFHALARYYIGAYGPGLDAGYAVAAAATVIALCHLFFNYSGFGLATGIAFAMIPVFTGMAAKGWLPIAYQQGPGLDYWTLVSLSGWAAWGALAASIWRAENVMG